MEALVYLGPLTVACLAAGSYVLEWRQGLATDGLAMLAARRAEFGLAAVVSFLVNLLCYLAIRHVSATTFKVAGCLKNVAVVWGGILSGDVVAPRELQVLGARPGGGARLLTAQAGGARAAWQAGSAHACHAPAPGSRAVALASLTPACPCCLHSPTPGLRRVARRIPALFAGAPAATVRRAQRRQRRRRQEGAMRRHARDALP